MPASHFSDHRWIIIPLLDHDIVEIGIANTACHDLKSAQDAVPALRGQGTALDIESRKHCNTAVRLPEPCRQVLRGRGRKRW